jgi:acetylornithine deacetylase/succinyl-diaminopimelate desuccinylase-like protein
MTMGTDDPAVRRLMEFLRIASIGTDPAYDAQTRSAAAWVRDHLAESGLTTRIIETDGHPCVLGETPEAMVEPGGQAVTVLYYGHYDVQPPDPLGKWTSPPFEPTVRDAPAAGDGPAIYARGASDDKGQVLAIMESIRRATADGGRLPCRVKVLVEGEEEGGSVHLNEVLERERAALAADVVVVSDNAMWDVETVAITVAMRGLVYFDLKLHGPSRDLHSGVYGGAVANPATMLARVLGRLFDDGHRVTIPGFYDDVDDVPTPELRRWNELGYDEAADLGAVGGTAFGEAGRTTLERRWGRPSCDINGLYGGYMGEGAKTVIPAMAGCKISFRIPASMDPGKVAQQFTDWLVAQDVGGCEWQITPHGEAFPCATPIDSPYLQAAASALGEATGKPAVLVREGATIPVGAEFKRRLGLDTLFIGFGLHTDNLHSPDESFSLRRYGLAIESHVEVLRALAKVRAGA